MAPTWPLLLQRDNLPRDTDSGPASPRIDTGGIVGIACGAGAVFLGAIGLFIIYWRRQKQYDRQFALQRQPIDENPFAADSPPIFTLDYKGERDAATLHSSTYTPSLSLSEMAHPQLGESSSLGGLVSAMPTHPAYIPRALVRGNTTNTTTFTVRNTPEPSPPPLAAAAAITAPRRQTKSHPDDRVLQAYLRAADGEPLRGSIFQFPTGPAPSPPSLPTPPSSSPPSGGSARSLLPPGPGPRRGPPPRLMLDTGFGPNPNPATTNLTNPINPTYPTTTITTAAAAVDRIEITGPLGLRPPASMQAPPRLQQRNHYQPASEQEEEQQQQQGRGGNHLLATFAGKRRQGETATATATRRIGDWIAGTQQPRFPPGRHAVEAVSVESAVW